MACLHVRLHRIEGAASIGRWYRSTSARCTGVPRASTKRERERFDARIEELDLELSLGDRPRLSNQLIQALLRDRAVALVVYITSMARARRLSVDKYSKRNGSSARGWSHDEVKIARMKPVCDPPAGS